MAEEQSKNPSRIWRIVLIVSLALNVAVIGIVGGALMRDKVGGRPPSGVEFGAGPLGRALSQEDRREIGISIRDRLGERGGERFSPRQTIREVRDILREEELDVPRLEELLGQTVRRASDVQAAAQAALVERISQMSYEERLEYADRLRSKGPRS